jgi:DNA-binding NarL/FixJ family response regulator
MKILLVEDEQIVAQNVIEYLTAHGFEMVGPADNYERGIEYFRRTKPELVLCDIKIKGTLTGIELMKHLREEPHLFKIIYLTAYGDEEFLAQAWQTKPEAFLLKPYTEKQLLVSIKMAVSSNALKSHVDNSDPRLLAYRELSLREKEILALVAKGKTSKDIADELFISTHTVETHRKNILTKMGFESLMKMIIFVIQHRL